MTPPTWEDTDDSRMSDRPSPLNDRAVKARIAADAENARLRKIARELYDFGRWTCGAAPEEEAKLWVELRDALGLPAGHATALGVAAPNDAPSPTAAAVSDALAVAASCLPGGSRFVRPKDRSDEADACITLRAALLAQRAADAGEVERLREACAIYDNALSTLRDHLAICVGDGDFAAASEEQADADLLRARAALAPAATEAPE